MNPPGQIAYWVEGSSHSKELQVSEGEWRRHSTAIPTANNESNRHAANRFVFRQESNRSLHKVGVFRLKFEEFAVGHSHGEEEPGGFVGSEASAFF